VPLEAYLLDLVRLLIAPWKHIGAVWLGIVPLYVSLLLGELYKSKVSFSHAVGNGFVMLWAGMNWAMHLSNAGMFAYLGNAAQDRMALAWLVTICVIGIGVFTVVLGFRKKDKGLCQVLGHTRFSSYFLILFYPMQTGMIPWNWPAVAAILIFALPAWFVLYLLGRLLRLCVK
jgi:hypothetical protein